MTGYQLRAWREEREWSRPPTSSKVGLRTYIRWEKRGPRKMEVAMRTVETGWLKGSVIRTARKPHRCNYWQGLSNGGRCKHTIQAGEQYVEGDCNDEAGGYGNDRYCMAHVDEQ